MKKRSVLAAAVVIAVLVASGFVLVHAERESSSMGSAAPGRTEASLPVVSAPTTTAPRGRHLVAPLLPMDARAVAETYTLAAFTMIRGTPTDAWVQTEAALCTASWRAHLSHADDVGTTATSTVHPVLLRTFSSWAPTGAVGATVEVALNGVVETLYVELRRVKGRYLVAATQ